MISSAGATSWPRPPDSAWLKSKRADFWLSSVAAGLPAAIAEKWAVDSIPLRNGDRMPPLGFGTWKIAPAEVTQAVRSAIDVGYRHLDCAWIYGNEAEIGTALEAVLHSGDISRDELWVTSKLWNNAHGPGQVVLALRRTLAALHLDYLDAYLMHWPIALRPDVVFPASAADFMPLAEAPLADTWGQMEDAVELGLCRHIGVANFSVRKLEMLARGARIAPEINQIECHPFLPQKEMLGYCKLRGIVVTAYASLGSGDRPARLLHADDPSLLEEPVVRSIAKRRGMTGAQVLLAWALQQGMAAIPKSARPERQRENLAASRQQLEAQDMQELAMLDRAWRFVDGRMWAVPGSGYTLADLWDE
jgi:alcohol dehydrogenase (NADP+)